MNQIDRQAKHYDTNPVLYPWPAILSKTKLDITYKPREVFLFNEIKKLGLNSKSSLLDYGCGSGILSKRISDQFNLQVKGIDISEQSINFANKNYSNDSISFERIKNTKNFLKRESFDFIISLDVLEHIFNQKKMVYEISRLLKNNGKLLIYTLNKNDKYSLDWLWEKLGIDIYKRAMHKRSLFVNINSLCTWLKDSGLVIKDKKYYGGFFTLLIDEVIMVSILISKRVGLFKYEKLGKLLLNLLNLISKSIYPVLNTLDYLWYKKGRSLGILVVAEKII